MFLCECDVMLLFDRIFVLLMYYCLIVSSAELPEKQEQLHAIYKVLEELPTANFNTLERLIFHLVRFVRHSPFP